MKSTTALAAALGALLLTTPASASVLSQTHAEAHATAPNPALAAVLADYEAFLRENDPISAAFEGDQAAKARWGDWTREGELARLPRIVEIQTRLVDIDASSLSSEDRLNHDFLAWVLAREVDRVRFDAGRLAFDNEGFSGPNYIGSVTRIASRADADAWLQRLEGIPALYETTTVNARRGLDTGFVQPRSVVESALVSLRNDAELTAENDPLLAPFATLPASIPAVDQEALRARARAIVGDQIMPARRAFLAFVEGTYLPQTPETLGIGQRPDGQAYYAFLARSFTTTDMTPQQIHELGLSEVARIRARMDEEMRAAGWTGDFPSFLTFLRTDPQFYAQTREDLIEKASEMAKRADGGLPPLFRTLPRLTYDVRPTPREIEAVTTTGRYHGGSPENGVPGGYIVNTSRLDQRPLYELPALTLHEAVPGHHLQIALQQEAEEGPYFRRSVDVTAFSEGWGLYAEFLGEEMGFYRTPYERFGRLSYEMWRACRLVADTGIHAMGWTIEQARACFTDNSALSPHNIETELQRYIAWPGQALAYKVGEIRLRAIRTRAEQALGDRFEVRDFHDALLVDGPLPLDLLDARMDAWIAQQQAARTD